MSEVRIKNKKKKIKGEKIREDIININKSNENKIELRDIVSSKEEKQFKKTLKKEKLRVKDEIHAFLAQWRAEHSK